ncbi:MAG: SDR family oxidoreductase [Chloroflexota bacterium]|nr:SDR family oxidoreductase [Chloroflexota bacterium]
MIESLASSRIPFMDRFGKNGPNGLGFHTTAEEVTKSIDLTGKTIVVTGANSGLGLETVRVLSLRGAKVIGMARTIEKANAIKPSANPEFLPIECDLSEPHSITKCANHLFNLGIRIDSIICNAGIMALPQLQQKYGVELQFLTNHIGHFMLVNLLMPLLTNEARITVVSSSAHKVFSYHDGIQFGNFSGSNKYNPHKAYGHSKLANLLFSNELANRLEGSDQTANAVHPGVIRTNLLRNYNPLIKFGAVVADKLLFKNIHQGAATQIYASTHPDLKYISGKYFSNCNIEAPSRHGADQAMAKQLWEFSENIVNQISQGNYWED